MDALEFYIGALEDAIAEHDAEAERAPAGTFGSNVSFLADKVVEAARAVVIAWDAENTPPGEGA